MEQMAVWWALWLTAVVATSATYLPPWGAGRDAASTMNEKSNVVRPHYPPAASADIQRSKTSFFKDDTEIHRYLKGQGRQLMLWRCRNAIQQQYSRHKPLAFIELFCNVLGTVDTVTWSHKGLQIAGTDGNVPQTGSPDAFRYWHTLSTHHDDGRHFSAWLDFRLRIYNATRRDSGIYWFRASSPGGDVEKHAVFVDIVLANGSPSTVPSDEQLSASKPTAAGKKLKKKSDVRNKRTWSTKTVERNSKRRSDEASEQS